MKTNCSPKIKRLILAVIAMVMLFSTVAMAKTVTLKYDKANKYYYAVYDATKNETVNFKMPVKYNGLLDVSGNYAWYSSTGKAYGPYGISLTMYNAKGKRLDYWSSNLVNASNGTYERYAVSPGNYYFRVKTYKGDRYVVIAEYAKKSVLKAPKGGASKAKAQTLARGKALTGIITAASYKTQKWFKFYVPSQGKRVKVRVQVNGGQGQTAIYVAGPNFNKTQKYTISPEKGKIKWQDLKLWQTVYQGSSSYITGPKSGWYYVLITKGSGIYKYSSSTFAIKWWYY